MANINTKEASNRYGPSVGWFEKSRLSGHGPPYLKIANKIVLYNTETLDRWFAACERRSTSETSRTAAIAK
jgi:hypothetical protein